MLRKLSLCGAAAASGLGNRRSWASKKTQMAAMGGGGGMCGIDFAAKMERSMLRSKRAAMKRGPAAVSPAKTLVSRVPLLAKKCAAEY